MWFKKQTYDLDKLIQGCADNDRKCQEQLYNEMFEKMYTVCSKYTKDETEALTILNDGFLKVFKNILSYNHQGSFEGWVRKIIYRSVSDHFRSKQTKISFLLPGDEIRDVAVRSDALEELFAEDIVKMLELLPAMSSRVLVLFAIEGYGHKEIAHMLSMSENTSKWHLSNARQLLRTKLSEFYQIKNVTG